MTANVADMEISLNGKVALVTGASRGIGKAIAKSYVEAGAKVMLMSRKEDALRAAAEEIGGDTEIFAGNAGDIETAQACVAATIKKFGSFLFASHINHFTMRISQRRRQIYKWFDPVGINDIFHY